MCLPSLLIGFGSFPNVQSVPRNNYIPDESRMNFAADFDGFSATLPFLFPATDEWHEAKCHVVLVGSEHQVGRVRVGGLFAPPRPLMALKREFRVFFCQTAFYRRVFV